MKISNKMLFLLLLPMFVFAQDITVSGSWSPTVDETNLQSGAGSNLNSTLVSDYTTFMINVSNVYGTAYVVKAHCSKSNWPTGLALKVQRTSNGTPWDDGDNYIEGGELLELSETPQTFFSGQGNRNNIYVMVGVAGLSVASCSPRTALSSIYFTINTP